MLSQIDQMNSSYVVFIKARSSAKCMPSNKFCFIHSVVSSYEVVSRIAHWAVVGWTTWSNSEAAVWWTRTPGLIGCESGAPTAEPPRPVPFSTNDSPGDILDVHLFVVTVPNWRGDKMHPCLTPMSTQDRSLILLLKQICSHWKGFGDVDDIFWIQDIPYKWVCGDYETICVRTVYS